MKIVNHTPHAIVVRADHEERRIEASDELWRVIPSVKPELQHTLGCIPVYSADAPGILERLRHGGTPDCPALELPWVERKVGLPPYEVDVFHLVSAIVGAWCAEHHPTRTDILVPGTGPDDEAVRENGRVIAVTRLKQATRHPSTSRTRILDRILFTVDCADPAKSETNPTSDLSWLLTIEEKVREIVK